jgi:regulator of RNase E activity RraA
MSENLHLVFSKPPEGLFDEEYNRWYDFHLGEILVVPGFVAARRYRLQTIKGDWTPSGHRYLSAYELEGDPRDVMRELDKEVASGRMQLPGWFPQITFASFNCHSHGNPAEPRLADHLYLLDARAIDPAALRLRTWKNGEIAQDARLGVELLFGLDDIVADLSRLMTLEPGDVILTGTPAGSTVVEPGDLVEIEVTAGQATTGRLRSPIVEAGYALPPSGAMPRMTSEARDAAFGGDGQPGEGWPSRPAALLAGLGQVSTATLASQLRKRGLNGLTMDGLRTTKPAQRLAGFARTLRYLPLREDLFARYGGGMNAQKQAVEQIRPGEVLVIDARQEPAAGTIGDILALRAQARGAAGIVTDGAIKDAARLAELDIPAYHAAVHPAVLGRRHVPWESGVTVACAGVTVQPGDLVIGDDDGVVVLPPGLAQEILAAAREQERQEEFAAAQVASGAELDGLYPLGERWRETYENWVKEHKT